MRIWLLTSLVFFVPACQEPFQSGGEGTTHSSGEHSGSTTTSGLSSDVTLSDSGTTSTTTIGSSGFGTTSGGEGSSTTGIDSSTTDAGSSTTSVGPIEQCKMMAEPPTECSDCTCGSCLAEFQACEANEGCVAIQDCAAESGCTGFDCLEPCGDVIDMHGGIGGSSAMLGLELSTCIDQNCTLECSG